VCDVGATTQRATTYRPRPERANVLCAARVIAVSRRPRPPRVNNDRGARARAATGTIGPRAFPCRRADVIARGRDRDLDRLGSWSAEKCRDVARILREAALFWTSSLDVPRVRRSVDRSVDTRSTMHSMGRCTRAHARASALGERERERERKRKRGRKRAVAGRCRGDT